MSVAPPNREADPRAIVEHLDRYIVGQKDAKRAVAVALRNRWRRQQVEPPMRDEISPKNIMLIGPTGVGKTEIARRLAKMTRAPFVKVEASKFTEVGYVGRDVDSMVRDLAENAMNLVRQEEQDRVRPQARENAEERLLDILLPKPGKADAPSPAEAPNRIFQVLPSGQARDSAASAAGSKDGSEPEDETRAHFRKLLREGKLDERKVEIEAAENNTGIVDMFSGSGMEEMVINLKDMLPNMGMAEPRKTSRRKVTVAEAFETLTDEEASKLVDPDKTAKSAVERAEQTGIIFIDEIDKVAGKDGSGKGPDISREGVQRDLLPIVEGSTVNTKHGPVRTDHVLFVASGAFHLSKPKDLIPELQGRFPIRVELTSLSAEDFERILSEPENALTKQYTALLATEKIDIEFAPEAITTLARFAAQANSRMENIGARRLHTIMERLLDELSFEAPEVAPRTIPITAGYVEEKLKGLLQDEDLSQYVL